MIKVVINQRKIHRYFETLNFLLNSKYEFLLVCFTIIFISFFSYNQILSYGLIDFDDSRIIEKVSKLDSFNDLNYVFISDPYFNSSQEIKFFRPVQNLSIFIDSLLSKNGYFYFHLTNLILHISNILLIYLLLKKLKYDKILSLFISLAYSCHPLLSFCVTWIPARGDLLVTFFSLLSLLSFISYLNNRLIRYALLHSIFLVLAVFSKEIGIVLPILFLSYYFVIYQNKEKILKPIFSISFILFTWLSGILIYFLFK